MDTHQIIYGSDTAVFAPTPQTLNHIQRIGHVFVCGSSPASKHALLWNMMLQDIEAVAGMAVLDSSGQFANRLLDSIPSHRNHDTYFINPADRYNCVGFNPFHNIPTSERTTASQEIVGLFKSIWNLELDSHPLLLDLLYSAVRVLMDFPHSSFVSLPHFFLNERYRNWAVQQCSDPIARPFWEDFEKWSDREKRERTQSVLTRLRTFLADENIRVTLGQVTATLDINRVTQQGQILLADLDRSTLGPDTSKLLGCLLGTNFRRALQSTTMVKPFYLYVPNCENFSENLFSQLFDGSLQEPSSVTLSTQQFSGFDRRTRNSLLSAENLITFRLSPDDARMVHSQFDLPQAEDALARLQPDRLACNQHTYELAALERYVPQHANRRYITRRSRNVLSVKRSKVKSKVDRFLLGKVQGKTR